jgi:surface antigen
MTILDFFIKWNNVGCDFDGYYGNQCMDLYRQYVKDVINCPQSPGVGGAKDVWTTYLKKYFVRVSNSPVNFPKKGDIVIWGTGAGPYGHIAICMDANVNNFISFDQNWPLGSISHFQTHNYTNVLGWLSPITKII